MAGALIGLAAACGGKVFVDTTASTGSGGSGASLNVGGAGAAPSQVTGGGSSCFTLPSALALCTGAVTTGTGGPSQCDFFFCDNDGNQWDANCTGSSCSCTKNGMVLCTCALNNGGDVCSGQSNCCGLTAGN
jgi:hypothetical protein